MIRMLMWALLIYIGYRIVQAMVQGGQRSKKDLPRQREDAEATHRDPVCGVYVSEEDAVVGRLEGQRHYFCSMACLEKYQDQLNHTTTP